jgi:Galactose oxidase-like, Early set domain
MRLGAMTHHTDSEQRYVAVDFIPEPHAGRLRAFLVDDATVAPPGWYMLWIIDTNNRPCARAPIVRLERKQVYLITDRSTFSKDEVAPGPATITFENSFYVVCDGFLPSDLGINAATPFHPPPSAVTPTITFRRSDGSAIPQMGAIVQDLLVEIPSLPSAVRQRFVFRYTVTFVGTAPFFQSDGTTPIENQAIALRVERGEHSGIGNCGSRTNRIPISLTGRSHG